MVLALIHLVLVVSALYPLDLVVNAVLVITKTKYLITFISTYLTHSVPLHYSNTLVCAWFDCSDIINQNKMGMGSWNLFRIFLWILFISTYHLPMVLPWRSVLWTVIQQISADLLITWSVEVPSVSKELI